MLLSPRKRAPSARSLETKRRILDAAERIFSEKGYDGSNLREIATLADVPVGLVQHHGGNKEELFAKTVKRRAEELSDIRIRELEKLKQTGELSVRTIMDCFLRTHFKLLTQDGPHWLYYGRLIAHVSANPKWQSLASECFDPTTHLFLDEILKLHPLTVRSRAATGQIYSVAALLAFFNASWRIETLSPGTTEMDIEDMIDFCVAGMETLLTKQSGHINHIL
ncbi:MAG: AcrR family transcriptional regulator [Sneathiella sp.]